MQKHPLEILADAFGRDAVEGVLDAACRVEAAHMPSLGNRPARQLFEHTFVRADQQSRDAELGEATDSEPVPQCSDATGLQRRWRCACSVHFGPGSQRAVLGAAQGSP